MTTRRNIRPMTRSALVLALSLALAACGGKTAAPADPAGAPAGDPPAAADPELCCCDYIQETGDGDDMAENQTFEMMPPDACAGEGGSCADDTAACAP